MEDYQGLVRDFERKQVEREKYCKLKLIDAQELSRRRVLPANVHKGTVLYLGYSRNAWHSTWIRRYYPGSLSFFEKDLQILCEKMRVQGSVFRIEPVPAVFLEYRDDVIVLVEINERPLDSYRKLMRSVLPFRLEEFWKADAFLPKENWLMAFKLPIWRPDLLPRKFSKMSSVPQGFGRPMGWTRHGPQAARNGLHDGFNQLFLSRLLKITNLPRYCPEKKFLRKKSEDEVEV